MRRLPDSETTQAQWRVDETHRKIARQRAIIRNLRNDGQDTEAAEGLLKGMLVTLRAFEDDCRTLEDEHLSNW